MKKKIGVNNGWSMHLKLTLSSILLFFVSLSFAQQKKVIQYFEDTQNGEKHLEKEYYVSDSSGKIEGAYVEYFYGGEIKVKGTFRSGVPIGGWEYFFENGKLKQNVSFEEEGKITYRYFFENGNVKTELGVKGKQKEGVYNQYFENGKEKITGKYKAGLKDSLWTEYSESGNVISLANYTSGKGYYKGYFLNGKLKHEGPIYKDWSEGVWKYYYEEGPLLSQGLEVLGVRNGVWQFFYKSGVISSEGEYRLGKPHGEWKYYYETGKINSEGSYADGFRDKSWNLYHEQGGVKAKGDFTKGDGGYVEYHQNGKVKSKGSFKKDVYDSLWTFYYDDGVLEGECDYVDSVGEYKGYYKNGNLKMKGQMKNGDRVGIWAFYDEEGNLDGKLKTVYESKWPELSVVQEPEKKKDTVLVTKTALPDIRIRKKSKLQKRLERIYYFQKKNREFKGLIVGSNPLAILVNNEVNVYVERYWQERLGYELNVHYYRTPLLKSFSGVDTSEIHGVGGAIGIKQKLYHQKQPYGTYYYAHELRYGMNMYRTKVLDKIYSLHHASYEYTVYVGNRLLGDVHGQGITMDIYIGSGIGYRQTSRDDLTTYANGVFEAVRNKSIYIPIRIGGSIGYIF